MFSPFLRTYYKQQIKMRSFVIELVENPLKEEDLIELSFEEFFEVLQIKRKQFCLTDMYAIVNVLRKRQDFSLEEKKILNSFQSLFIRNKIVGIEFLNNPEFKSISEGGIYNMKKAYLDYNPEIRHLINSNLNNPDFFKKYDEDNTLKEFNPFMPFKLSELAELVIEENLNPSIKLAKERLKFKQAVFKVRSSIYENLIAFFELRKFSSIDEDFVHSELEITQKTLNGTINDNHLTNFLGLNKEEELKKFKELCTSLIRGIEPDFKENYLILCKIFGLKEYEKWLSKNVFSSFRIFPKNIDNFKELLKFQDSNSSTYLNNGRLELSEDSIQIYLEEILDVPFHKNDWGGEINDLYTSNLTIKGKRVPTAFLLKGKGMKAKELQIRDCGKNGDQILRLLESPAQLFVIQYVGNISENVIKDISQKIEFLRLKGKIAWFCILDGQDTYKLLKAYQKI